MNATFRLAMARGLALAMITVAGACAPKVEVSTKDPIVINLNIKHEILIRVDNDVENLLDNNSDLFGDLLDEPQTAEGDDQ
jgi:hypothetical protein